MVLDPKIAQESNLHVLPEAGDAAIARRKNLPVSIIVVPVKAVCPETIMAKLLTGLAIYSVLPVVDKKKRLIGVIRDQDVLVSPDWRAHAREMAENHDMSGFVLRESDTIAQAIARFGECDQAFIPIVDAKGLYTGQCASRSHLFKLLHGLLRPPRTGGMATPLGVYMTSGYHISGAGLKGLVATGIVFGLFMHVLDRLWVVAYSALITVWPLLAKLGEGDLLLLETGFTMVLMLSMLRLTPISGLHAAEHMTINAMENDLELTEATVCAQPREHLRCGTNLMVFIGGIQLLTATAYGSLDRMAPVGLVLYIVFWAVIIAKFWRPAGLWLQRHFTTRPPTPAQLASGIKAGRELLDKFIETPHPTPSIWRRIWGSGLPVLAGSFALTAWLIGFLLEKLGI